MTSADATPQGAGTDVGAPAAAENLGAVLGVPFRTFADGSELPAERPAETPASDTTWTHGGRDVMQFWLAGRRLEAERETAGRGGARRGDIEGS